MQANVKGQDKNQDTGTLSLPYQVIDRLFRLDAELLPHDLSCLTDRERAWQIGQPHRRRRCMLC
jgi:hypothetical protein